MNENTNMNTELSTPTPEAIGGQGEKLFTQEQVNDIIRERLARERAKGEPDERETALMERERAVKAQEAKYKCMDYLRDINISEKYRKDFLEVLDTSDFDKFKSAVDRLGVPYIVTTTIEGADTAHPPANCSSVNDAAIAEAFKPKKRF